MLVCKDERHIARLLQLNLERQGYAVQIATDCASARAALDVKAFALITLDKTLPDGSSDDLVQYIRQSPLNAQARVLRPSGNS